MGQSDTAASSTFGVQRGAWADPVLAAMVAPPVIVSAEPIETRPPAAGVTPLELWRRGQLARSRGNMPVGRHRSRTG